MNKSVYRNFYYIKENIADFFAINKKQLFISILCVVVGITLGICIGIKNASSFTFINCSDRIILSLFCDGSKLGFFVKKVLESLFIMALILVINNFSFLSFLNYILFGYLAFKLSLNSVILIYMLKLTGVLYVFLCYFLINIIIIFLYITVFLICKSSSDACGNSSKFSSYPYKAILIVFLLIVLLCAIMLLISSIFCNFISIII